MPWPRSRPACWQPACARPSELGFLSAAGTLAVQTQPTHIMGQGLIVSPKQLPTTTLGSGPYARLGSCSADGGLAVGGRLYTFLATSLRPLAAFRFPAPRLCAETWRGGGGCHLAPAHTTEDTRLHLTQSASMTPQTGLPSRPGGRLLAGQAGWPSTTGVSFLTRTLRHATDGRVA